MRINPGAEMNHNALKKGIYINKINDDITTYDIRLKEPNSDTVLTNSALHTIEHLFKTYIATTKYSEDIIFFGAMGSRTGFYLLTRNLSDNYSIELIKDGFRYIAEYWGVVPKANPNECGNCLEHNLPQAKLEAKSFLEIIENWTKEQLEYPKAETNEE